MAQIFQNTVNFLFAFSGKIHEDAAPFCQRSRGVDSSLFPQAPSVSRFRFFSRIPSKHAVVLARFFQGQGVTPFRMRHRSLATVIKFLNSIRRANFIAQLRTLLHDTVPHVSAVTVWLERSVLYLKCFPRTYFISSSILGDRILKKKKVNGTIQERHQLLKFFLYFDRDSNNVCNSFLVR